MTQVNRLPNSSRINTSKIINFTFNGKPYQGFAGDSLASALLANGVNVVGRSFKYARPRGIVGHGVEEPNGIIQLGSGAGTVPNLKVTQIELYEGLEASSVNGWPSVNYDVMSWIGAFGRLMPPGFYYKTFMYPQKLWMTYEHFIRKAAGLGKSPLEDDPDSYDTINQHCDVLVVGAGPSGLMAALEAGLTGARVIIADEQSEFGGTLLAYNEQFDGQPADDWLAAINSQLSSLRNVKCLTRSTVFGYYDHNFLTILERLTDHLGIIASSGPRQCMHRVRAKQVVLATGALERPLVFAHNDVPGVMQASSVSTYINRFSVAPGNKLVLATNNDNAYRTAIDWYNAGREVVAVVDSRYSPNGDLVKKAESMGIKIYDGHGLIEAKGGKRVKSALIAPLSIDGTEVIGAVRQLACDLIATSGGWSAAIHLSSHTGAKPVWDEEIVSFRPGDSKQQECSVGACKGTFGLHDGLVEGAIGGARAAHCAGFGDGTVKTSLPNVMQVGERPQQALFLVPHIKSTSRAPSQFVDFQLDVSASAIELAVLEGFESVEHVKRYTALGFGTDQGKLGNIYCRAILAEAL